MNCLKEAEEYYYRGYAPIPVKRDKRTFVRWHKFKNKSPEEGLIWSWFSQENNLALIVGKAYGFVVLDIEAGADFKKIKQKYEIPNTVCAKSGGGGYHLYFRYPQGIDLRNFPLGSFQEEMEIKADGYIIAPPSLHQSGARYVWVNSIFNHEMAPLPAKILEIIKGKEQEKARGFGYIFPNLDIKKFTENPSKVREKLREEIKELREEKKKLTREAKHKLDLIYQNTADVSQRRLLRQGVVAKEGVKLASIEGQIRYWNRMLRPRKKKGKGKGISGEDILKTKIIPITNLLPPKFKLQKCGRDFIGLCPLHNDHNPSFHIFTKTNSYFCFACRKGGNPITLIQQLQGLNFFQAVKHLLNLYYHE